MTTKAKPKNLADFKNAFDPDIIVPRKLQAVIDAMLKEGAETWEYETEVVKRSGVSQTHIARYRGQFDKHIVEVRESGRQARRVWFASIKVAATARGE
jgi:hypothetical protein